MTISNQGTTPKPAQTKWFDRVTAHPVFHPLFLLLLCVLSYGVLLPWLSFYADDWIMLWTYQKLGAWGVDYYHITNRPFLAPLYQILLPLLGAEPWRWQLFAVLAPWITSLSGWWLVKSLWPTRIRFAVFASILIAVFPGYLSHGVALTTGHRNIILAIFLLSLTFTVLSLRKPKRFWLFYLLALLTSIYNMLAMEYFLFMELMRPFVIWIVLSETEFSTKQKLGKTIRHFLPFFLALCAILYWRTFLFPYQTFNHSLRLFNIFREDWLSAIALLTKQTLIYFWIAMVRAWTQIVTVMAERVEWGSPSSYIYLILVLITAGVSFLVLRVYRLPESPREKTKRILGIQLLELSSVPWLIGGIPFILVGLAAGVGGYETRYLLPFMLVSCLWVAFLILFIFKRYLTQTLVLSAVVGLSVGLQFISSNGLRVVDTRRRNFFWNLSYRIPQLKPGTILISNDMYVGDGTTAWTYIINWLYKPDLSSNNFAYMIALGSQLDDFLNKDTNDIEIIGAHFTLDWSKLIVFYDDGMNCPQFFNPDFPEEFPPVENRVYKWLEHSNLNSISQEDGYPTIDPATIHLGSEPARGWCYYYEKADLARQIYDWESIRDIGDKAVYQLRLQSNLDTELNPFILAYALGGRWEKASELMRKAVSLRIAKDNAPNTPLVLSTWNYIDANTPASLGKTRFMELIQEIIENS